MPPLAKNITNKRFNRLIAIKPMYKKAKEWYWLFRCDCGNEKILRKNRITCQKKSVQSCGCALRESARKNGLKSAIHKMSRTLFYKRWFAMKDRCRNPKVERYPNYGGRGIKVCDQWQNFINFMEDMYESFLEHCELYGIKNTSLDRIDTNGHYNKENCHWATYLEQRHNRQHA